MCDVHSFSAPPIFVNVSALEIVWHQMVHPELMPRDTGRLRKPRTDSSSAEPLRAKQGQRSIILGREETSSQDHLPVGAEPHCHTASRHGHGWPSKTDGRDAMFGKVPQKWKEEEGKHCQEKMIGGH